MRGSKAKRIRRAIKAAAGIAKMPLNTERQYVAGRKKQYLNSDGSVGAYMVTYVNHPYQPRALFQRWKRGTPVFETLR